MRPLLLLCVLAGCFSDEAGLHIVVQDKHAEAKSVDMYIVVGQADSAGMTPMGAQQMMQGKVLLLDSSAPPTNHLLHDGEVVFNILPANPGDPLEVPKVVFVGRNADGGAVSLGEMHSLSLEANGSVAYRFDMVQDASSFPAPSDDNRPSGVRIWEWNRPNAVDAAGRTNCVDIEFAEDAPNGGVTHYFLVPPDDRDCDGVLPTPNVCPVEDDYLYDPNRVSIPATPPLLVNATCGSASEVSMSGTVSTVCSLGAPPPLGCVTPDPIDCLGFTGPRFCTTNKICEQSDCLSQPGTCNANPGATNDWTRDGKGATFLRCSLGFDANGGICTANEGSTVSFNFEVLFRAAFPQFASTTPVSCTGANLWVLGDPPATTAAFYQTATVRPKMTLLQLPGSCDMTLGYGGNAVHGAGLSFAYGGIDVTLGDTPPTVDHIVLPVRVDFVPCTQTSQCVIMPGVDDLVSLQQCVH